ncbi:MAG TPA: prenyltransferase/squalene oxidase repeat-containing protein, partial [Patescibacteria group bacterium]
MFEKEIKKAVTFILLQQKENGSFNHESISAISANPTFTYTSTFPSSLITLALKDVKYLPQVSKIIKKSADFLKSQNSNNFSFNYWDRNSQNYNKMSFPDDLDDTSLALSALFIADKKFITGKILAKIISLLTAVEFRVGGPYKTWLVSKESAKQWKDVDIAVNANIAYFLHLQGISLPNLETFFDSKISKYDLLSAYYPNEYPIIYFLSRFYNGKFKKILIKKILSLERKLYWENPLYTALAVSSLINLHYEGPEIDSAISYIVKKIKNNSWDAFPFYVDPAIKNFK